ncbi:hypothetical protein TNCV_4161701 [Trichonephila clavipes]|nr:hypothetical protein TNCV_4161701 [Trichonephila clavipes]
MKIMIEYWVASVATLRSQLRAIIVYSDDKNQIRIENVIVSILSPMVNKLDTVSKTTAIAPSFDRNSLQSEKHFIVLSVQTGSVFGSEPTV